MRLVTYESSSGPRAAGVRDGAYVDLNQADSSLPVSLAELIGQGHGIYERVKKAIASGKSMPAAGVRLLAPIPAPQKVICIGLNYADHAKESGQQPPPEPVVFCKFPTSVCAHGDNIVLPPISSEVDYEAELVAVIGQGGKNISESQALNHVAGYCCGHDVSARDWQLRKPGGQWLLGKTFDTFAPFGPELVTPDEVGDPSHLRIQLRLSGKTLQDSTTAQLIFAIPKLVSYVSQVCTLTPGDVIFTGTPPGVGAARKPPVFMKARDIAEVEIEKLGVLRNPVVGPTG